MDTTWVAIGQTVATIAGIAAGLGVVLVAWRFFDDVHAIRNALESRYPTTPPRRQQEGE